MKEFKVRKHISRLLKHFNIRRANGVSLGSDGQCAGNKIKYFIIIIDSQVFPSTTNDLCAPVSKQGSHYCGHRITWGRKPTAL